MRRKLGILIVSLVLLQGCALFTHKEEIGVLVDLGKDADRQDDLLSVETKVFDKLKAAFKNNKLHTGVDAHDVLDMVGEPVTATREDDRLRWSYKAGNETWLSGEVVHLYFDQSNKLTLWECVRFECE